MPTWVKGWRALAAGRLSAVADRGKDGRGRPLYAIKRLRQRGAVVAIRVDVVARRVSEFETDRVPDDECDRFGFEFSRVAQHRSIGGTVQKFMGLCASSHKPIYVRKMVM